MAYARNLQKKNGHQLMLAGSVGIV